MNASKNTDGNSRSGGESFSATPSIDLLNKMIGSSPAPRMLTKTEFALLCKCAEEVAQVTQEVLERSEPKLKR